MREGSLGGDNSKVLGASLTLLRTLRVLNGALAVIAAACFVASFPFEPAFRGFFAKQPPHIDHDLLMLTLRIWMLLAVPTLAAVHILLARLIEMVETVRLGDPFVADNAVRMRTR